MDNCIDEHTMGYGKNIDLYIQEKAVSVRDYGRGIPLGKDVDVVSKINTGAKYDSKAFQKSVGLNGVGTKAVNALSSYFMVYSVREGEKKGATFERGELISETPIEKTDETNGTYVEFIPDDSIFKKYAFKTAYLDKMMWNYCYLNRGLSIYFNGEKYNSKDEKDKKDKKDKKETEPEQEKLPQFLKNIISFSVSEDIPRTSTTYSETVHNILPDIETCIDYMENYLTDNLSIANAIKLLEPFHVYPEDVNYSHYNKIRWFLKHKIQEYNEHMKDKSAEYGKIFAKSRPDTMTNILNNVLNEATVLGNKKQYKDLITELYLFKDKQADSITSSELLFHIEKYDGYSLFYSIIARVLLTLYTPNSLLKAFEFPTIEDMSEADKIRPRDCTRRFLTKKYTSISDLQKDNNKKLIH
jgi:DNA gyrase/topoisomerase IV subunit B